MKQMGRRCFLFEVLEVVEGDKLVRTALEKKIGQKIKRYAQIAKQVMQLSFEGEILTVYPSIKVATMATGISSIIKVRKNIRNWAGSFRWAYVEK